MIAVFGEALVDLIADPDGRTYRAHPGGSPANVAVGLARLGVPVTMLARLAGDAFGRRLREHLAGNGVDLRHAVTAEEPASLAVATLDATAAATYDFWVQGSADWQWRDEEVPDPLPATALHAGSLAAALEPGATVLTRLLARERARDEVTISFDPNLRPGLMGDPEASRARVERQVALAHVVKVSEDDLHWTHPGEPYPEVARCWLALGPALVVVTLGERGAYAATGRHEVERPAARVAVVDTVGAGDAFTAGLLAGLSARGLLGPGSGRRLAGLDAATLTELTSEAVRVAGLTCARPGADPPRREEVDAAG